MVLWVQMLPLSRGGTETGTRNPRGRVEGIFEHRARTNLDPDRRVLL